MPAAASRPSPSDSADDGRWHAAYRRAFGFETRFFEPEYEYGELRAGDAHLGIASHKLGHVLMPGRYVPSMSTSASFGLEIGLVTDDVPGAFARAVAEGAEAVVEPKTMPWGGTVAYVRGIEGTLIVLCTVAETRH